MRLKEMVRPWTDDEDCSDDGGVGMVKRPRVGRIGARWGNREKNADWVVDAAERWEGEDTSIGSFSRVAPISGSVSYRRVAAI